MSVLEVDESILAQVQDLLASIGMELPDDRTRVLVRELARLRSTDAYLKSLPGWAQYRKHLETIRSSAEDLPNVLGSLGTFTTLPVGIEPELRQTVQEVLGMLTDRVDQAMHKIPDDKGGRPREFARALLVLELADLYEETTGAKPTATISFNPSRKIGYFTDLVGGCLVIAGQDRLVKETLAKVVARALRMRSSYQHACEEHGLETPSAPIE